MDAEAPEYAVDIASALSGEGVCALRLPSSAAIRQVKRAAQEALGTNVFCQRLLLPSTGRLLDDSEVLEDLVHSDGDPLLERITLGLVKLRYADHEDAGAYSRLLEASKEGAASEVEQLLRMPACPEHRNHRGWTPLWVASGRGHEGVVQLLCEAGANANSASNNGTTPLLLACQGDHIEVVRLLLEAGADTDRARSYGDTALMMSVGNGSLEAVQLLCKAGANKDYASPLTNETALSRAAGRGHLEVVRYLCQARADVNSATALLGTPLTRAARQGHLEIVRVLCAAGADRDKVICDDSPLSAALMSMQLQAAWELWDTFRVLRGLARDCCHLLAGLYAELRWQLCRRRLRRVRNF